MTAPCRGRAEFGAIGQLEDEIRNDRHPPREGFSRMKLPGLIDVHVHVREPGAVHKEDWDTATAAALAGGFTTILAMPNTNPPLVDRTAQQLVTSLASDKARCDFGLFVGATADNADRIAELAPGAVALKMYLDQTYGPLLLDDMSWWMTHFAQWPGDMPIAVHAEGRTLAAMIAFASLYDRPVHLCHISRRDEVLLIRKAKEQGVKVTCEVCPHHLLLCTDDEPKLGAGRSQVKPPLQSDADRQAMWDNLDVIDCFATDHAPHTPAEKDGAKPPPGMPGLETALPLLLTAVHDGRLTLDHIRRKLCDNPRRIFNLPKQEDTYIEVDPDAEWQIRSEQMRSRSGWTPFEGWTVKGRVERVVLRGREVFASGRVLAEPGYGKNVTS